MSLLDLRASSTVLRNFFTIAPQATGTWGRNGRAGSTDLLGVAQRATGCIVQRYWFEYDHAASAILILAFRRVDFARAEHLIAKLSSVKNAASGQFELGC